MKYIANYHTHHPLCKHAEGPIDEYVKAAIKHGLSILGFSDHAPSALLGEEFRMAVDEFSLYSDDVDRIKQAYHKEIKIYKGIEIEYLDQNDEYYADLFKQVDYFILGQHYIGLKSQNFISTYDLKTKKDIMTYSDEIVSAMKTQLFSVVAHPDLFLFSYPTFDENAFLASKAIIEASIAYDVPLEYNANGIRRGLVSLPEGDRYYYPRQEFWELVSQYPECKVLVSADAHNSRQIYDEAIEEAFEHLKALNIEPLSVLNFK